MALHSGPKLFVDDRGVLSRKGFALVDDLAPIDPVLQYQVQRPAVEPLSAIGTAVRGCPALADDPGGVEIGLKRAHRAERKIAMKNMAGGGRLRVLVDR